MRAFEGKQRGQNRLEREVEWSKRVEGGVREGVEGLSKGVGWSRE